MFLGLIRRNMTYTTYSTVFSFYPIVSLFSDTIKYHDVPAEKSRHIPVFSDGWDFYTQIGNPAGSFGNLA